jgi:cyclopropane fatty-acyl-phospholipid synthase-like methyltransferase
MDPYQITFQTWNKVAQLYQQKFMDLDLYNDTYDRFCELVEKQGAWVLEIGCGPGNITRYLVDKRPDFRLEAIDVAPAMIELAKANVPAARFRVMDVRALHTIEGAYDGIMCGFCLPYLSREDSVKLFTDCAALLPAGGIGYFSAIEGAYEQSGFKAASTGDETYVYYHPTQGLLEQLHTAGFELVAQCHKPYAQGDAVSTHVILIVRKK